MSENLAQRIDGALRTVLNPRLGVNVVDAEMIDSVATTRDGRVRFTLQLADGDDPQLALVARQAVEALDGITDVRVEVREAASRQPEPPARPARTGRALPMFEQPRQQPQRPAAPTPERFANLGRVIAISSGKGGVGKSTVTTNLAVALAASGKSVGLMDADIYGPNVPRMMGIDAPPPVEDQKIIPLEAHGVKLISLGFLVERDQPAIWRGPIVMKIIGQFLRDVRWGQLDYLLVDMPPGTGDAQLSLVQSTQVDGAIIVTTPQDVATGDALRGAKMFERVGVPLVGIVENMSWFECRHCGGREYLFGEGGGARLALELNAPLLGEVPLYPPVLAGGEGGVPIVLSEPEAAASIALVDIARQLDKRLGAA